MLKLMLIQHAGETAHQILSSDTEFPDFIELVTFKNFGHSVNYDEPSKTVQVPHNGKTYTMLMVDDAVAI